MKTIIESYQTEHKKRLLEIFTSNVPEYFDPREEEPFDNFLDDIKGEYFVVKSGVRLIGAGGFCEAEQGEARICWLMIDRSIHQTGVGTILMKDLERRIDEQNTFDRITLKTTQHTDKFYEKIGYETKYTQNDFWFPGMHLYFMEKLTKG